MDPIGPIHPVGTIGQSNTYPIPPGTQMPTAFNLAPGTPGTSTQNTNMNNNNNSKETLVMDYTQDFPDLPKSQDSPLNSNPTSAWARPLNPIKSTVVTQIFHLPVDERSLQADHEKFGEKSSEQNKCNEIAKATNTGIELCESKDHSLTFVVTGKRNNVEDARKQIIQGFQTKAAREIRIPKDHHRILIGKERKRLIEMERETDCRIMIPGRDSNSDIIKITGPKEGIEKAVHKILLISDEQSLKAQETLMIPKIFYPWIRGPGNSNTDKLAEETKARINIPPPSANSEIIVITGEKEGVYKAAAFLRAIYEEKKDLVKSVTCKVAKDQHRFVIGPQGAGLADILRETDVSVEIPPEKENSDTITLRGPPDMLGNALTLVYQKASSVVRGDVECPQWLHKFIIGPRGANIRQIVGDKPKLTVDFDDAGSIYLEGSPEDVKSAQETLSQLTKTLKNEMAFEVLHIAPIYHPHVIGRQGANIIKIKQETGVSVIIPDQNTNSDEIRIEGKKEGVKKAVKEISEIASRLENEKSKDVIIEQRFHKMIIGPKGETIRDMRDKFPGVQVSFPEPGCKSNVVSMRGPKDEVDKLSKHLNSMVKEMLENNFQVKVPIFKDFHKVIIGKGGANIRKIREETDTKIDLPSESSGEDAIAVTGKKANVEKAVAQLHAIQNELASIVSIELSIPQKLHVRLIGNQGRLIQDISEQCGGVQIKFPPEKQQSDKVTIRGPREEAEKAQKLLADLAKDKELSSHQESVKARPEMFRFLIGRGGTKIKKVRDGNPNVRILFPRAGDQDQESIHIIGKKEDVGKVKKDLEVLIDELKEVTEITMDVDEKWHRHFIFRGAAVVKDVQEQCGGVIISFPKANANSTKVSIKGAKDCVQAAQKRVEEIVSDLEVQITSEVTIPNEHHVVLLSNRGEKVREISAKYNVQIKFPDRAPPRQQQVNGNMNGGAEHEGDEAPRDTRDIVTVSGRPENVEAAKEALLDQIFTKSVEVPFEYHRFFIGKGGQVIQQMSQDYDVRIKIPDGNLQSNEIVVMGPSKNCEAAEACMRAKVDELDNEAKDRELKSFMLKASIPAEFHQKIIGPRGSNINALRAKYDVEIRVPGGGNRANPNRKPLPMHLVELAEDEILIVGYEKNVNECKEAMEQQLADYRSMFIQEIPIDARIHPRLIGQRGKNVRKMMEDYEVEIRFPRDSDPDPNLIAVSGKSEDAVYDCIDHLRNLEEEYLQDITESYQPPKREVKEVVVTAEQNVTFVGAPWNPSADGTGDEHFPTLGGEANGNGAPATASKMGPWGFRR